MEINQTIISEPRRDDFKNEIEFDLARIEYWYKTKDPEHRLFQMVQAIESNLLCKRGMSLPE